jgi:hypothetical protein
MPSTGFDQSALQWLTLHLGGDDRCPECQERQWQVSDPSYPIIQFTCRRCGHTVRTDMTAIDKAAGSGNDRGNWLGG